MDALALLKQDHRTVERLFKRFEASSEEDSEARRELVDRMIVELSRHAAIEEALLYPTIREAIPDDEEDVLESLEEHHIVKWTLQELAELEPDAERFGAKVTVLMENVRHHVEEEETELFPRLRKALTREQLRELGARLADARRVAPTRPHPRSPDSPPANLLTTPLAAALDRGRDLLRKVAPRGRLMDAARAAAARALPRRGDAGERFH